MTTHLFDHGIPVGDDILTDPAEEGDVDCTGTCADYVDIMTRHYAIAALWSTVIGDEWEDSAGEPLDTYWGPDDIHPDTYATMRADCLAFVVDNGDIGDMAAEQAGHDFWLTRNGHGAGFWDRGLGDRGDRLSALARPFGDFNLWTDGEYVRADI